MALLEQKNVEIVPMYILIDLTQQLTFIRQSLTKLSDVALFCGFLLHGNVSNVFLRLGVANVLPIDCATGDFTSQPLVVDVCCL